MHIAIDAREWSTTTGRYVSRLVQELEKIDARNTYSILMYPEDITSWQPHNPQFRKVVCPHKEFSFDEQIGFKKQLDGLKPDLVHFPMVQQPVWYRGKTVTTMNDLTTIRFKNPSKNPVIFTAKQQIYKWLNKEVVHKADALLAYTQFVKNDVIDFTGVDTAKITVTPLAAERLVMPAQSIDNLKDTQFLLYVGRPMPHKNLPRLIEAYKILKTTHPGLRLVLAGRKDILYSRIEADVIARKVSGVIFTDFISDGQLRWLYEQCAAYIVPSLSEGFGLPGLEAMAQGAPVISSNATCLPEVYGDAAAYFDPYDPAEMTTVIANVIEDTLKRQAMITAGRRQVGRYSWRTTADQTLAVYRKVLES